MAVRQLSEKGILKVVARCDDAIPQDLNDKEWEEYTKTLDEVHLRLESEPTRFCMRKSVTFEALKKIKNEQIGVSEGKAVMQFGYSLEEVRCSLVDIENPKILPVEEHILFKKDADGFAHRDLIAELEPHGIINDLFLVRQNMAGNKHQKK